MDRRPCRRETALFPLGIFFNFCGAALLEGNTIDLPVGDRIRFYDSGIVFCFENRTPGGQLIRGVDGTTQEKTSELATDIEDIVSLSFL
jgi:hypothetical protein